MRNKLHTYILLLLILSNDVLGKDGNKTKLVKGHKKQNHLKDKSESERVKRSVTDDDDKPFWANRGKKLFDDNPKSVLNYDKDLESDEMVLKSNGVIDKYQPFWGSRGRRDSSVENYIEEANSDNKFNQPNIFCKHCSSSSHRSEAVNLKNDVERREELVSPFWGNRGRRNSDASDVSDIPEAFWGSRGRRQDDSPFWGNRGRRDDEPFWGTRGRRQDTPFWGNRGRREDEPFWGTRGRRDDSEPFWGNRGRRQESEPFWGNRGRRDDSEPFWGNRGRRKESEPFWGNRGRRKEDLKDSILRTIDYVEDDIENLSRLRRSDSVPNSFWVPRGRDSKMKLLFNGPSRSRVPFIAKQRGLVLGGSQPLEPGSVHDNRMFVEEPRYILVERASRSSAEEDPFYISRGKKYYLNYDLFKAARDRRGAIEEIVKSVRNDPYYIARGKKDTKDSNVENSTVPNEEFMKIKELICSAVDLVSIKNENNKVKREAGDNERDRRTILKKLALQLQMDPYFVSRGKKDDPDSKENIQEFINDVATKCT